ncbi:hypothetical protein SYJ56_19285 [Algoriphagus sp. D3-2-R+10]|uniref:hypothetical protein n=1 Tax=Algoriphagus aurantiacus TaxID=3103948 RepID=UPI002B3D4F11|nr:hypothetical protein [Algoriphagus sp. D3-2-R+10]MEB2777467.1 hypothetical protein [Algoriphagus sp. D3-2-R+10]
MKTSKKYTREIKEQFGYLATWLPSTPLSLGDIGILKNNQFTKISNLSDFGIQFEIEIDKTKSDIEHSSKGAVSISTKASGTVAPQGSALAEVDAGITVEFSKENAILFKANRTTSPCIKDQIKLGKAVIELYKEGKWDKDWSVITEKVDAESATILISSSSSGKIELKAKGKVEAAKLDIADAKLGFELTFSKDLSTKIIGEESLTPLFKASKVNSSLFNPPIFRMNKIKSMDLMTPDKAKSNEELLYFGEVDYDFEYEEE